MASLFESGKGRRMNLFDYYRNRRVLVTGHTGFKGGWLVTWLHRLGAQVTGWSIDIPTEPSLFKVAGIAELCDHHFGDINDHDAISDFVTSGNFDTVFHLAAQPLVRLSYKEPVKTLTTNVVGMANVLEAVRAAGRRCAVVAVTSDKCYHNPGSLWGFREPDPMGGADPYSMSKGAAELVIAAWRSSYFATEDKGIHIASARAGNVIGGGDWSADRIVTDCIASLRANEPVRLRNPHATRPWQHVVEPLAGYLTLGALLGSSPLLEGPWNFGPALRDVRPVKDVAEGLIEHWGAGCWDDASSTTNPKEATTLSLNCEKAQQLLGWQPVWGFDRAILETAKWFRTMEQGEDMRQITQDQIAAYQNEARAAGVAWAIETVAAA
jgi:CDP-glucose 4,6-dehydratase